MCNLGEPAECELMDVGVLGDIDEVGEVKGAIWGDGFQFNGTGLLTVIGLDGEGALANLLAAHRAFVFDGRWFAGYLFQFLKWDVDVFPRENLIQLCWFRMAGSAEQRQDKQSGRQWFFHG